MVTHSYPRVTYSDPKVTHSDPKVTHSDPTHLPLPQLPHLTHFRSNETFDGGWWWWVGGDQL